MNIFIIKTTSRILDALIILILSAVFAASAFAHGGEDHGDSKPAAVTTNQGTVTRSTRIGDFEMALKHALLEPDHETTARIFVTKFETNEPVKDAKVLIEIIGENGKLAEVAAEITETAGVYAIKLPPIPSGTIDLKTRLDVSGTSQTATFAEVPVQNAPAAPESNANSWTQIVFWILAGIVGLSLLGGLSYFAVRNLKKARNPSQPAVSV